jgi:hypothetical protein
MRSLLRVALLGALLALALDRSAPARADPPLGGAAVQPALTPSCPREIARDTTALRQSLLGADYDCAEAIAVALAPLADDTLISNLLELIDSHASSRARRNAMRVLGRFAERPAGDAARELVLGARAAEIQASLLARLRSDRDADVLHDAIWLADTLYFPFFAAQPELEAASARAALDPAVRSRAITAVGRLIFVKQAPLPEQDLGFILRSLGSDDAGVRAQAALICWRLKPDQLSPGARGQIMGALDSAWNAERQATATSGDATRQVVAHWNALANLAQALDHYAASQRLAELRASYETEHLPNSFAAQGVRIRSALPAEALSPLPRLIEQTRAAFLGLVGPALSAPLPGEPSESITMAIFADQAGYRAYLSAFAGVDAETDGVFVEEQATIYTYQRLPTETEHALHESIQHELGHFLAARYIFPGSWTDAGYHAEPKGWADEGMAELLAGLRFDASGAYSLPPRQAMLNRICGDTAYRGLAELLAQRAGYGRFGKFDYDYAWALTYYLFTERRAAVRQIYQAYRADTYRLAEFATVAGVPSLAALEADWHAAIRRWCAAA